MNAEHCPGCVAASAGADRLDCRHRPGCGEYDAFYDAADNELALLVPPTTGGCSDAARPVGIEEVTP